MSGGNSRWTPQCGQILHEAGHLDSASPICCVDLGPFQRPERRGVRMQRRKRRIAVGPASGAAERLACRGVNPTWSFGGPAGMQRSQTKTCLHQRSPNPVDIGIAGPGPFHTFSAD